MNTTQVFEQAYQVKSASANVVDRVIIVAERGARAFFATAMSLAGLFVPCSSPRIISACMVEENQAENA